jgi:CDP-4-dehydro-6-deoxyglucose reductase, E3
VQFEVNDGETVLAAALRQGHILPYSCQSGACGTCKGRIESGRIDYGTVQEKALPDADRAAGKALFCQARPLEDLVIDVRVVSGIAGLRIKRMPARVQTIERVSDDAVILTLRLPANETLVFMAGQYVEILLKDGSRRAFSLGNAPHASETLQLHVRRVAGGSFTTHVFESMKEKEILRLEGPFGTFFLREDTKPIVLVASGTGFAPIKSVIEEALHKGITRPVTIYWGGRRPKDLYMNALAEGWAAAGKLRYVPVVSDALPEDGWRGRTGFVHRAVMEDFPDLSAHQVYACGVPIMVDSAKRDFIAQCRLPEEEFFADSFTTQADTAPA